MTDWHILAIGFAAQLLFTSRLLFQWIASEKAKKVVTPALFWKLSLLASLLLLFYGLLRKDLPIIFGQLLLFGIYVRNLKLQGEWRNISRTSGSLILLLLLSAFVLLGFSSVYDSVSFTFMNHLPNWLLMLGIFGQLIFNLRFLVQWLYSERSKTSVLPLPFWILSLCGSSLILIYAIFRKDPVLFLGHLAGSVIYIRNMNLSRSSYVSG